MKSNVFSFHVDNYRKRQKVWNFSLFENYFTHFSFKEIIQHLEILYIITFWQYTKKFFGILESDRHYRSFQNFSVILGAQENFYIQSQILNYFPKTSQAKL